MTIPGFTMSDDRGSATLTIYTYLSNPVRGRFYQLHLVLDVWSRKIVGWAVHENQSAELAAPLICKVAALRAARPDTQSTRKGVRAGKSGQPWSMVKPDSPLAACGRDGAQPRDAPPAVLRCLVVCLIG